MFVFVEGTAACSKKSWNLNLRGIHINRDACIVLRIKLRRKITESTKEIQHAKRNLYNRSANLEFITS